MPSVRRVTDQGRRDLQCCVFGATIVLVLEKILMRSNDVNFRGCLLRLAEADNVAVATVDFPAGAVAPLDDGQITLIDAVAMGHKAAVVPIAAEEKIVKYGCPIGSAVRAIRVGEHVHTHNIKSDYLPTRARG
ncbi:MAG: UxaA family hydrolase [Thermoguttaceae bacterium]